MQLWEKEMEAVVWARPNLPGGCILPPPRPTHCCRWLQAPYFIQNLIYQFVSNAFHTQLSGFQSRADQDNYAKKGHMGNCETKVMTAGEVTEDTPSSKEETENVHAEMPDPTQHPRHRC